MARRKHASMFERSAAVAVSWIKASTAGLAKLATGRASEPRRKPARLEPPPDYGRAAAAMRLLELESLAAAAYVVEPEGDGDGVDGRAAAYIMKIRAKHRSDDATEADASYYAG